MTIQWTCIKRKKPPIGVPVQCRLQHWHTNGIKMYEMIRVDADDHNWVTADDYSELDLNWNVISWRES
jgi:hypothetical protein